MVKKKFGRDSMVRRGKRNSEAQWDMVKEVYSPAVVAIEMSYPRPFSYNYKNNGIASGFVVDKKNGLILTNKHVVTDGPIRAKAKFLRNEEVDLVPIFRDPTHDYAFFKFDPSKLTHTTLTEIKINPDAAVSGTRVLVMGNNAGEKLTYVDSTLARTDRTLDTPNTYNTFFISATDISVRGSSGGPVLNDKGEAVGMTCCGILRTNSSFYLPLQRVVRSLLYLRRGLRVPRGTLQIAFSYQTYEELSRMGVSDENLNLVREDQDEAEGMLVVNRILAQGTGYKAGMRHGDVLKSLNGNIVHNYVDLESVLDDSVESDVDVSIIRAGDQINLSVRVQDLYEICANEYIEVSRAVVHKLEYGLALACNIPAEGVFLASHGYMFKALRRTNAPSVITGIGEYDTPDLDSFQKAMEEYPNGSQVAVRYFSVADKTKTNFARVTVDKRWYPFVRAQRNDREGNWEVRNCAKPAQDSFTGANKVETKASGSSAELKNPLDATVHVTFSTPFSLDGIISLSCDGVGLVVDAQLGLVICERMTVPTTLGDIFVTFNSAKMVRAKAVFVHPFQEFSMIQYDTEEIKNDKLVNVCELELNRNSIHIGQELEYYAIDGEHNRLHSHCAVTSIMGLYLHATAENPRFVPRNTEYFMANESAKGIGGVYVDGKTKSVCGFNFFFSDKKFRGLRATDVIPYVDAVRLSLLKGEETPREISLLPVQLNNVPLVEARATLNLDDDWALKLLGTMDPYRRSLLTVSRIMINSDANMQLRENDLILAIDGQPVSQFSSFTENVLGKTSVSATVLRNREVVDIDKVETSSLSCVGTQRIVIYAGMVLQAGHTALKFLGNVPDAVSNGGVYITSLCEGSPAEAEGAASSSNRRNSFITAVNNVQVTSLDDFLEAVSLVRNNDYVRLTTLDVSTDKVSIYSVRADEQYWKTRELRRNAVGAWSEVLLPFASNSRNRSICLTDDATSLANITA
mmetsp:Transcript_9253/g.10550  ORF Transcript_9253/g.10550 Transcript_9253/m.10550 type:complete len:971 (-) Transcript_9253:128-3040(-)